MGTKRKQLSTIKIDTIKHKYVKIKAIKIISELGKFIQVQTHIDTCFVELIKKCKCLGDIDLVYLVL